MNKQKISAKIIADSIGSSDNSRITSLVCTFPRYILSEVNTHRMFSRNSASSRAIPFNKMLERVKEDPFIPIAWQKDHSGMQGTEYITDSNDINSCITTWLQSKYKAAHFASELNFQGKGLSSVTKQLCNRLLEPYIWHTAIITATEWENFFKLRCPKYQFKEDWETNGVVEFRSRKDAIKWSESLAGYSDIDWLSSNKGQGEIHIMALAEAIWDAMNESTPKTLQPGEWHIPFGDSIDEAKLIDDLYRLNKQNFLINSDFLTQAKLEIATARCARVSYLNYEGKDDYEADFKLFDNLSKSGHWSPFEHCAMGMSEEDLDNFLRIEAGETEVGWCRNFKGFIQLRYLFDKHF